MAKGKKQRKHRTPQAPKRKIMAVRTYTHGPVGYSGSFVPPKRIKQAHRASMSGLSLKRWLASLSKSARDNLGVAAYLANKAGPFVRKPGKILRHARA